MRLRCETHEDTQYYKQLQYVSLQCDSFLEYTEDNDNSE